MSCTLPRAFDGPCGNSGSNRWGSRISAERADLREKHDVTDGKNGMAVEQDEMADEQATGGEPWVVVAGTNDVVRGGPRLSPVRIL